jgi:hypothetical protein
MHPNKLILGHKITHLFRTGMKGNSVSEQEQIRIK